MPDPEVDPVGPQIDVVLVVERTLPPGLVLSLPRLQEVGDGSGGEVGRLLANLGGQGFLKVTAG